MKRQRKLVHFKEILVRFALFSKNADGFNLLQARLKRNNLDNAADE